MDNIKVYKDSFCAILGVIGGAFAQIYGGWSAGMTALVVCMAVDYITGLLVAGVFHASKKSENGALESRAGWKGLVRKGVILMIVLVAVQMDKVIGTDYFVRDASVIAFIANEALSIIENAGLMGIPMPKAIVNAVEVLQQKAEEEDDEEAKG